MIHKDQLEGRLSAEPGMRIRETYVRTAVLVMLVLALPASGFSDRHRINP